MQDLGCTPTLREKEGCRTQHAPPDPVNVREAQQGVTGFELHPHPQPAHGVQDPGNNPDPQSQTVHGVQDPRKWMQDPKPSQIGGVGPR